MGEVKLMTIKVAKRDAGDNETERRRIIQQIEPIKIKGEALSETVVKERSESCYLMKIQQQTGYIHALLNDSAEDVWNDL